MKEADCNEKNIKAVILILMAIFISMPLCGCSSDWQSSSRIIYPTILKDIYVYDQGDFLDDIVEQQVNSWLVELEHQFWRRSIKIKLVN